MQNEWVTEKVSLQFFESKDFQSRASLVDILIPIRRSAGADKDKAGANLMVIHLATDECKARIIAGNIDAGQTAKMFRINQGNGLRQTALGQ